MYVKYLCRVTGTTSSDHVLLAQRLWRLTSLHSVNSAVPEDSQLNSRMTVSLSLLSSLIGVSAGSYKNSKSLYQLEDLCLNMYSYKQTLKMRGCSVWCSTRQQICLEKYYNDSHPPQPCTEALNKRVLNKERGGGLTVWA